MLALSLLLPLLILVLLLLGSGAGRTLFPLAPLPALILVFSGGHLRLPFVLTGLQLGVDSVGRPLLLLATLLWLAAGIYARSYLQTAETRRFGIFWTLTWLGTLGTLVSLDAVSFYVFYAVMSLAAVGLIIHSGSDAARRASRVYLVMALLGEVLILSSLLILVGPGGDTAIAGLPAKVATHPWRPLIVALLMGGFGIKLGVLPLHVWLPLAHPAAPTPASAILSGVLVKLGLLGWIRFLPMGELALPGWSVFCLVMGLGGAFYGVVVGLGQQNPKTVLAYSSISQMGLAISLMGIAMNAPQAWPQILSIVSILSLHHGLAKGALFLGQGVAVRGGRQWTGLGLVFPALALSGAPLSSGALAKNLYKSVSHLGPGQWPTLLGPLLSLSSAATTLLVMRFLLLSWPRETQAPRPSMGLWLPWLALLPLGAWLPWWWAAQTLPTLSAEAMAASNLWGALVPLMVGLALAWIAHCLDWRPRFPEGDLLILAKHLSQRLPTPDPHWLGYLAVPWQRLLATIPVGTRAVNRLLGWGERRMRRWSIGGLAFLLLLLTLMALQR